MKTPKKLVSMRLSESTIKELSYLSTSNHLSQAAIVEMLVHLFYDGDFDKIDEWMEIARRS